MEENLRALEERIAEKIRDFQADSDYGKPYDAAHVDTWIRQFDEADREAILLETDHLLEENYMSRKKIEKFLILSGIQRRFSEKSLLKP